MIINVWDDCVEFEAYLQSNTWNNRYVNQDEIPQTVISGQTSDISIWVQHEWYDWIKFRDTAISFPDDKEVLGRYLGPSIDVGPAMMTKILKANGEVVHRSTYSVHLLISASSVTPRRVYTAESGVVLTR